MRAAVELSQGHVLSAPGIKGFRLAAKTSVADYHKHERAAVLSTIKRLETKLLKMDRAVYNRG